MIQNILRSSIFATSLVLAGGALMSPAFAEVVYNRGSAAEPETVDPHKTSTVYEAHVLRDLFEGLVMQDSKADLIPGAAESWTISDDGKTYTFKLRAGATWSDGSPRNLAVHVASHGAPRGGCARLGLTLVKANHHAHRESMSAGSARVTQSTARARGQLVPRRRATNLRDETTRRAGHAAECRFAR